MGIYYVVFPALILVLAGLIVWFSVRRLRSLGSKNYRKWRKITERVLLAVVSLIAGAAALSATFNAVALRIYEAKNPPPGTIYLVNGHKMHINCSGSGSPTLILDAGLGNDDFIWGGVQPILSRTTRVCSYDRAGFGWSDALPAPRDADHIATELHGLLEAAHIDGPIVLMGHSIAGMYLRDYASRYPQQVAGLIFVDSSTPFQNKSFLAAIGANRFNVPPLWLYNAALNAAFAAGLPRLFGYCSQSYEGFEPRAAKEQNEDFCSMRPSAVCAEAESIERSSAETIRTGPFGDLPILIFSHDPAKPDPGLPAAQSEKIQAVWDRMQSNLTQLSSRSRRIVAKGSSHNIHLDRADLIEKEVPLFIEQVRGAAPAPPAYWTTVSE